MSRLGLRARLVAAFLLVAALTALLAAVLTGISWHRSIGHYLDRRDAEVARSAAFLAADEYARAGGRWSAEALHRLVHQLALTGYDFRLSAGGRQLLDTTKAEGGHVPVRVLHATGVVDGAGHTVGDLQVLGLPGSAGTPADAEFRAELDRAQQIAAGIAGGLALLLAVAFAGGLARPLRRLAAAARDLRGGGAAVPEVRGPPEVQEIRAALADLSGDLARQAKARRQLAEDLAHELRTPLALMQSRIEGMQDGVLPLDASGLAAVHTEVLRLTRLIGQIERLASGRASPPALARAPVALEDVARGLHDSLAGEFEARGVALRLDLRPAMALGDRDATAQIAANLASNALKYTAAGTTVTIATRTDDHAARLAVVDQAPMIPEDESERIFQRFQRGTAAKGTRGLGLGLPIARELAEAQGGALHLHAGLGGNRFELRLPAAGSPTG